MEVYQFLQHQVIFDTFRKSIADVEEQVTQLSQDCVTLSHSLLQKCQQLQELQEKKQQAVDEEDYEKGMSFYRIHDKIHYASQSRTPIHSSDSFDNCILCCMVVGQF